MNNGTTFVSSDVNITAKNCTKPVKPVKPVKTVEPVTTIKPDKENETEIRQVWIYFKRNSDLFMFYSGLVKPKKKNALSLLGIANVYIWVMYHVN